MVKRKALDTVDVAARARVGAADTPVEGDTVTTGLNLPRDLHALLRAVALKRAKEQGGARPSVSGIIVGLCRQHQGELEKEAGRYLDLIDLL